MMHFIFLNVILAIISGLFQRAVPDSELFTDNKLIIVTAYICNTKIIVTGLYK